MDFKRFGLISQFPDVPSGDSSVESLDYLNGFEAPSARLDLSYFAALAAHRGERLVACIAWGDKLGELVMYVKPINVPGYANVYALCSRISVLI